MRPPSGPGTVLRKGCCKVSCKVNAVDWRLMGLRSRIPPHAVAQPPRPSRRWLRPRASSRGQTMVELGLVLPIFLLILIAVIEFGYWAAVNSAVHTASREGARFGSVIDDPAGPDPVNYVNCPGILATATDRAGAMVDLTGDITISYERDGAPLGNCGSVSAATIQRWDRVVVTTTYAYSAITPLMDIFIPPQNIVAIDRRSIVK